MRIRSRAALRACSPVLALVLLWPGEARPEQGVKADSPIVVGSKVRLVAPAVVKGRVQGIVTEMDETSLVVRSDARGFVRVGREAITRLEVSTGRHRKTLKGMVIGAGVGAVLFQTAVSDDCNGAVSPCTTSHAAAAGIGLLVGAVWGAGIGTLFKGDRWSPVSPDHLRLAVGPVGGRGLGVSLRLGW